MICSLVTPKLWTLCKRYSKTKNGILFYLKMTRWPRLLLCRSNTLSDPIYSNLSLIKFKQCSHELCCISSRLILVRFPYPCSIKRNRRSITCVSDRRAAVFAENRCNWSRVQIFKFLCTVNKKYYPSSFSICFRRLIGQYFEYDFKS